MSMTKMFINKQKNYLINLEKKMLFIAVFGKRGSGKSTLIKGILSDEIRIKTYDYFIIFKNSPSREYPIKEIKFTFDKLKQLLDHQEKQISKGIYKSIFIIFDDCFSKFIHNNKEKQEILHRLFFDGRHYLIGVCLASQYMNLFKSEFRANIDKLYIKQCLNYNVINKFIQDYCDKYQTKRYYHEITSTFKKNFYSTFLFNVLNGKLYEITY